MSYLIKNKENKVKPNCSSNNNKNFKKIKNTESFTNMGKPVNSLPNMNQPSINFPIQTKVSSQNPQKYSNANTATDKYFDQVAFDKAAEANKKVSNIQQIYSLTGQVVDKKNFKHNNMLPFFGAKLPPQNNDPERAESILDNLQGSGSQHFTKKEVAPLFKPEQNMHWAHGAPNNTDFLMSRMNPSTKMANIKCWEEQTVGPGLNQGYTTKGSGGFNSGLEARDKYLPPTVDQLRVKTNPKVTFGLGNHEGPANSYIKNPGIMGAMEKNLPDTYYVNGQDRWFTTTGLEKGQTNRSEQTLWDVNRPSTTTSYFGGGKESQGEATYVDGKYHDPHRPILDPNPITNAVGVEQFPPSDDNWGRKGYVSLPTNRQTTAREDIGIVGGFAKAIVAPILDVLRPSRKENVIGNLRPTGNAGTSVEALPVYNPADRTRTTIRETTDGLLDCNHFNVENQNNGGYLVSEQQSVVNQRDSTNCSNLGNPGGPATQYGNQTYNAAYNQHNNVNKSYPNRPNQGGTQIFNETQNIHIDKVDNDRNNNRMWAPQAAPSIVPSKEIIGSLNTPQMYDQCINADRINPDILQAFKENPYTQSLHSAA